MDMKTLGIGMVGASWGARMHHASYRFLPSGLVDIRDDREPRAGIDLAVDCVSLIYSAYMSAEEGRIVSLK